MKERFTIRRILEWGGIAAGVILVAFGVAALVLGMNGRSTVQSNLKQEYIFGTPDMTPTLIKPEAAQIQAEQKKIGAAQVKAGVPASQRYTFTKVTIPSESVAGLPIDNGGRARTFAQYMRIHALGGSSGLTYSQMGRFAAKPGTPPKFTDFNGGTNIDTYALIDPKTQQPVSNGTRNTWVTETALTSALNLAYTAEQISVFGIVVGVALLLTGIGFLVLAIGGALRWAPATKKEKAKVVGGAPVEPKPV
jgi:uncharacterized iron-regulated membrane protein